MGSFLKNCTHTKKILKENSEAIFVLMAKKTKKINLNNGKSAYIPIEDFTPIPLFMAKVVAKDYGIYQLGKENEIILLETFQSFKEKLFSAKKYRLDGTNEPLTPENIHYASRFPAIDVISFLEKFPKKQDEEGINNLIKSIERQWTYLFHDNDVYQIIYSVYHPSVFKKGIKIPMIENGIIFKNAKDYVNNNISNDWKIKTANQDKQKDELLICEYLFKLGVSTNFPEIIGQYNESYIGNKFVKFMKLSTEEAEK